MSGTATVQRSVLRNGIRILTEPIPGFASATIGLWVENGSAYERPDQGGISHFLEHLFFKGTARRSAREIAEAIDAVGGVLNAFTGKEYTCYYAKVLHEDLGLAQDLLEDLFLRSKFEQEEIDRERTVVLQEISELEDSPDDFVHELFHENFWPQHPLSRPICGTAATVTGLQRQHFLDFLAERYRPDRILITAAGAVDHAQVVGWAERAFSDLAGNTPLPPVAEPEVRPGLRAQDKALEQVHLCLGAPGLRQADERRYAAYVLNTALGGGMSSRLFQEVREKRGKAYSISSFLSSFRGTGYLAVSAGLSAECVHEVVGVVLDEFEAIRKHGLDARELARAKSQIKGNMLLALESSDSRMSRIAKNEMYLGRDVEPAEVAREIDAVDAGAIREVADVLLQPSRIGAALLGNLGEIRTDDSLLRLV